MSPGGSYEQQRVCSVAYERLSSSLSADLKERSTKKRKAGRE